MEKQYYTHAQIGKAKHVVSYHDGVKTHNDGSAFFDIEICRNKRRFSKFVNSLIKQGYKERSSIL
jgi:hypothetical protein